MLANNAAGVASIAAGLTAEAGCVAGVANALPTQLCIVENAVSRHIRYRDLCRGNKIVTLIRIEAEKILLELGQLAGAAQRVPVDDVGYVDLAIAMLAGMQIQHELDQGPVQPSQRPVHDIESRAGNLTRGFEVHLPEAFPEGDMVEDREVEAARIAPARHLHVVRFRCPIGHIRRRDVWHSQQQLVDVCLGGPGFGGQRIDLAGNTFQRLIDLGLGPVHAHALPHQHADLLRCRLALRQQVLGLDVRLSAARIQCLEVRHIEVETALAQGLCHSLRVLPDGLDVQHCLFLLTRLV